MRNGFLLAVIVLKGIFLWMNLFYVILGDFEQEKLLQISPNPTCGQ